MKKNIVPPYISIVELDTLDVITTSGDVGIARSQNVDVDDSDKANSRNGIWDD